LVIYCQTTSVIAAHAAHCATYCTWCRPLIRAFSRWIRIPPPTWGGARGGGVVRCGSSGRVSPAGRARTALAKTEIRAFIASFIRPSARCAGIHCYLSKQRFRFCVETFLSRILSRWAAPFDMGTSLIRKRTPFSRFRFCPRAGMCTSLPSTYRGNSPIRKRTPLGPYPRPVPRILGGKSLPSLPAPSTPPQGVPSLFVY